MMDMLWEFITKNMELLYIRLFTAILTAYDLHSDDIVGSIL